MADPESIGVLILAASKKMAENAIAIALVQVLRDLSDLASKNPGYVVTAPDLLAVAMRVLSSAATEPVKVG